MDIPKVNPAKNAANLKHPVPSQYEVVSDCAANEKEKSQEAALLKHHRTLSETLRQEPEKDLSASVIKNMSQVSASANEEKDYFSKMDLYNTCLYISKHLTSSNTAELFATAGINPKKRDEDGSTFFHLMVKHNGNQVMLRWCVDYLINEGVDINAKDSNGLTALHIAVNDKNIFAIETLTKVETLNPNIKDPKGNTALHMSCNIENESQCQKVVECFKKMPHLDLNSQDKSGLTVIQRAVNNGQINILKCLKDHKDFKDHVQNVKNANGENLIIIAIKGKDVSKILELLNFLKENGVPTNEMTNDGMDAIDMVKNIPQKRVARSILIEELLLSGGTIYKSRIAKAAIDKDTETVKNLLEAVTKVEGQIDINRLYYYIDKKNPRNIQQLALIHIAAMNKDIPLLKVLQKREDYNPHVKDGTGATALDSPGNFAFINELLQDSRFKCQEETKAINWLFKENSQFLNWELEQD